MFDVAGFLLFLGFALLVLLLWLTAALVREMRHPPRHSAGLALARGCPIDPDELELDHDDWMLDRPDGAHLPVWEIKGNGGNLTAVFVHGWGQSRIEMLRRLQPYMDLCARLVLYDLRGHGDATGPTTRLGPGEERDLHALLERLGGGPVVLVGFSMGAVIAFNALAEQVDATRYVVGVIAYGAYDEFHRSLRGRLHRAGLPARPVSDLAMLWHRIRGIHHRDTSEAAKSCPCPALVVHGEHDLVSPPEQGRRLADAAPEGRFILIENGGHLDAHVTGGGTHADAVIEFITQVDAEYMVRRSQP